MARTCYGCRLAPATCTRWIGNAGRSFCGACAEAVVAARPPQRRAKPQRRPSPPPKPPCLPGRAHHWDCPPGMAPLGSCRICGSTYQFQAPPETSWLADPDARVPEVL